MKRTVLTIFLAVFGGIGALALNGSGPSGGPTSNISAEWLFSTFKAQAGCLNPQCEQLVILNGDGVNWPYANSCYAPPSGHIVRDPSIHKWNGVYWLAHTIGDGTNGQVPSTGFDLAYSTDGGVCYKWLQTVDMSSVSGTGPNAHTNAPELFIDDDNTFHIVVTITQTGVTLTPYEVRPITALSPATPATWQITQITGTTLPNMYDMFTLKIGSTYNIFYVNNSTKFIEYMSSSSLTSGYTITASGDWAGWGGPWEGPCVVLTAANSYRIYVDGVIASTPGEWEWGTTSGLAGSWSAPALVNATLIPEHGTVIPYP